MKRLATIAFKKGLYWSLPVQIRFQRLFVCIVVLYLPILLTAQLKHFDIRETEAPTRFTINIDHPDCGQLVIHSSLKNLRFESNMQGIRETKYSNLDNRYIVFLTPIKQRIIVKASGFIEADLWGPDIPQAKDCKYYTIEERIAASGKGNFTLISDPAGADIIIDGLPDMKLITPYTFEAYEARNYNLHLRKKGYHEYPFQMRIEANKTNNFSAKLIPSFGELVVQSTPSDCEILIDGKLIGKTPLRLIEAENGLQAGTYELMLRKERHESIIEQISIVEGKRSDLQYNLKPLYVNVVITSEPENSTVLSGSNPIGKTPLNLMGADTALAPGQYSFRLIPEHDWFDTVEFDAELTLGNPFIKHSIHKDKRRWLSLKVSEYPFEAYLDGVRNTDLEAGTEVSFISESTNLRVFYTGANSEDYAPYEEKISLIAGERKQLNIRLNSKRVSLVFNSTPNDITLRIFDAKTQDAVYSGSSTSKIKLFPGQYVILASKNGYQTMQKDIIVSAKQEQTFDISMDRVVATQPKEPLVLLSTYDASKHKYWTYSMFAAGASTVLLSATSLYYNSQADKYKDFYEDSHKETDRRLMEKYNKRTNIYFSLDIGSVLWLAVSAKNYFHQSALRKAQDNRNTISSASVYSLYQLSHF